MTKINLTTALGLLRLEPEERIFTRHEGEECSINFTETTVGELTSHVNANNIKVTQIAIHWYDYDATAPLLTIEE